MYQRWDLGLAPFLKNLPHCGNADKLAGKQMPGCRWNQETRAKVQESPTEEHLSTYVLMTRV